MDIDVKSLRDTELRRAVENAQDFVVQSFVKAHWRDRKEEILQLRKTHARSVDSALSDVPGGGYVASRQLQSEIEKLYPNAHVFPLLPYDRSFSDALRVWPSGYVERITASDIQSMLEEQEVQAAKDDREFGSHVSTTVEASGFEDEEAPIQTRSRVPHVLTDPEIVGQFNDLSEKSPFSTIEYAAAVSRFALAHANLLEGQEGTATTLLQKLYATIEHLERESVPPEIVQFLKAHLWSHGVEASRHYYSVRELSDLPAEAQSEEGILAMLASRNDYEAVRAVFQKNVRNPLGTENPLLPELPHTLTGDPRLTQLLASWLADHPDVSAFSMPAAMALRMSLDRHLHSGLREQFHDDLDDYARWCLRYDEHHLEHWSTPRWKEGMEAHCIDLFLWLQVHSQLSLADSWDWLQRFDQKLEPWAKNIVFNSFVTAKTSDEERAALWTRCLARGPQAAARLLENYPHAVRKLLATNSDITDDIRQEIVIPALASLTDTSDENAMSSAVSSILSSLNFLSRIDPQEAQMLLEQCIASPTFKSVLLQQSDAVKQVAYICYAQIIYARPENIDAVSRWEQSDVHPSPLPISLMQQFEAESGMAWSERNVPILQPNQFTERWWNIVTSLRTPDFPREQSTGGEHGDGTGSAESQRQSTEEEMRDDLLDSIDCAQEEQPADNPDAPILPQAPSLSKEPKIIGRLSRPLEGAARYVLTKICKEYDPRWQSYTPIAGAECIDTRDILHARAQTDSSPVTLTMHVSHGSVIPHPMGSAVTDIKTNGPARARWASHWSRRIDTRKPVDVVMTYQTAALPHAGKQSAAEVIAALPPSLQCNASDALADMSNLPPSLAAALKDIELSNTPYADVLEQVQSLVLQWYKYEFILSSDEGKEKYRTLLSAMPYADPSAKPYLDFIHSFGDGSSVLGKGICGQLSTVLLSCLRSIGCPVFLGAGYFVTTDTITTNDGHAWPVAPLLDDEGRLFLRPVEATSGEATGSGGSILQLLPEEVLKDPVDGGTEDIAPEMIDVPLKQHDISRHALAELLGLSDAELPQQSDILAASLVVECARKHRLSTQTIDPAIVNDLRSALTAVFDGALHMPIDVENIDEVGAPFDPNVRSVADKLLREVGSTMTPGASAVLQRIVSRGEHRFHVWAADVEKKFPPKLDS
jgi:hypothetical protein